MVVFGVDLSDFDRGRGSVDVAAMARDGIQFLTHKATEGTKVTHAYYGQTLNQARIDGVPFIGAYMVPRTPGNNGHGSIQAQVDFFLAYLDAQTPWWRTRPEFFLQVDTEHWGYDDVDPRYGTEACRLLRAQTDKFVIHYAPRWAYGDTIGGPDPLWASSYGTNPAMPYRNAYPGDGSSGWAPYSGRTPTILQYGSKVTIGSQPGCDINAYRGTLDQLRALITGGQVMDDRLLGGWKPTVDASGGEDGRTVGIHAADMWRYIWDGKGAYDPGRSDPDGQSTGVYLDALLKRIRDYARDAATASRQTGGAPTQGQVDAAILKAMQDPTVQKGIGDAIASHLRVVS